MLGCRPWLGRVFVGGAVAVAGGDCWVGVVTAGLAEESVLLAVRRYRPGDGLTDMSGIDKERSGTDVDRFMEAGRLSAIDLRKSPSSRVVKDGAASE